MSSFGVQIPLTRDSAEGFTSLKSLKRTINQNLKMLILTIPGERVMDVDYGVGISRYLFSSKIDVASSQIENKIRQQVTAYLPIIKIKSIDFTNQMDNNTLGITIVYDIPDIGTRDILQFAL